MTISARSPPAGGGVGGRADGGGPGGGTRRPGRGHRGRGGVQPQGRGVAAGLLLGVLKAQARAEPLDEVLSSIQCVTMMTPPAPGPLCPGWPPCPPWRCPCASPAPPSPRGSWTPRPGWRATWSGSWVTWPPVLLRCCPARCSRGHLSSMFTFM